MDEQLPCRCGNADPSLFADVDGEVSCLVCAYARRDSYARRVLEREARGLARGDLLPAGPFGAWLREAERRHGLALLIDWSGWHDKGLREVRDGVRRVVPTEVVDRCLQWEGTTRLDDIYDLDSLWRGAA